MKSVARYDGLADWYDEFVQSEEVMTVALASLERMVGPGGLFPRPRRPAATLEGGIQAVQPHF